MRVHTVTITGIDDQTPPEDALRLSEYYKVNIEWGLLISKSNAGKTQYPSRKYVEEFINQANGLAGIAGHLNGHYLRELINGNAEYPLDGFQRVQLNFARQKFTPDVGVFFGALNRYIPGNDKHFIFQMEGVNDHLYHMALTFGSALSCVEVKAYPLFDCSLGNGITPDVWPCPDHSVYNGYAGGLGPDNIKEQLKKIEDVVGGGTVWIDMTTKVRTNDKLDIDKVRRVLDEVSLFNGKRFV